MKATTVKEVLVAARWILENHGWGKGFYKYHSKVDGWKFCAVGALDAVEGDLIARSCALKALQYVTPGGKVTTWNDMPGRTKEEVLWLFDQAIKGHK